MNNLSQILYIIRKDAMERRMGLRAHAANQFRENITFLIDQHNEGVRSPDYDLYAEIIRQRILKFILNADWDGQHPENN